MRVVRKGKPGSTWDGNEAINMQSSSGRKCSDTHQTSFGILGSRNAGQRRRPRTETIHLLPHVRPERLGSPFKSYSFPASNLVSVQTSQGPRGWMLDVEIEENEGMNSGLSRTGFQTGFNRTNGDVHRQEQDAKHSRNSVCDPFHLQT